MSKVVASYEQWLKAWKDYEQSKNMGGMYSDVAIKFLYELALTVGDTPYVGEFEEDIWEWTFYWEELIGEEGLFNYIMEWKIERKEVDRYKKEGNLYELDNGNYLIFKG